MVLMRRCACVLMGVASGLLVGASTVAAATPSRVRVGSPPRHPARSRVVGALPGTARIELTVTLKPRDPAGLATYAAAVSTPGSSLYHHYLTVGEFRQRFGPTRAQIDTVRASLAAEGLRPGSMSANGLAIPVSASAGAVAKAFSLSFQRVALPTGRTAFANTQAPQFTTSSAGIVQSVIGLDTLALPHPQGIRARHGQARAASPEAGAATPQVVTGGPQPCSAAAQAAPSWHANTADQISSAYQFSSLYGAGDEGAGQTIAVFELEPNDPSDIAAYQSCYGTNAQVGYEPVDGGAGSGPGGGEAALDIEDVIGLAPEANVLVYQGPNTNSGVYDTYNAIVSDNEANVISTSWGLCEPLATAAVAAEDTLFQEAAAQGQSVFAASGDEGSEACYDPNSSPPDKSLEVSDPASQPFVTGVGGTTLQSLGPPPSETAWNDRLTDPTHDYGAGGGGFSTQWSMPTYQSGAPAALNVVRVNNPANCGPHADSLCREVPDVSADADPDTGYLIYWDGGWIGIGGTSAAAPTWAALAALTNASSTCNGAPIGFANPVLYTAAANGYSSDFNDVTTGNNDYTNNNNSKFKAGTAYDLATGLGTPIGSALPAALCNGGTAPTGNAIAVNNPGPQTSVIGTNVSLQITSDDDPSATYTVQRLPNGLTASAGGSGLITGTPTTAGNSTVTVTATDGSTGAVGQAGFRWTIIKRASDTSLSCSPASISPGGLVTCTATVSDGTAAGAPSAPTGTVTFAAPGQGSFTGSGPCVLTAATPSSATCQVTYRPSSPGAPAITASYAGDSVHQLSSGSFTLSVPAAPLAQITSPANNQTFALGQSVRTTFACSEGSRGPGLSSCRDSSGAGAVAGAGHGTLNTATVGSRTYSVTAISQDGQTGRATIAYTVVATPINTAPVAIRGRAKARALLTCSTGAWTGSPTRFTYQWSRDGTPIATATSPTYKVQALDEGNTLTCTVTAANVAGTGRPATSAKVGVPVPRVAGCPRATGRLSGTALGLIRLGTSRKQAERAYRHSSNRGTRYQDFFCLTPIGIRAGYGSPKLLDALSSHQRKALQQRVIWISTASPFYAIDGVRPGASVAAAATSLKLGTPFRIGANQWYLAPAGRATAVLKVRGGIVQEIGIATRQLTKTRHAQRTFLTSFK